MYQALYRKYRPKNFDEVVGQEHITSVLKQEIASGRIGHAYLFTGSRGTGKTSCSKIIAKAVNCPHQQDGNPCGVCDICRGIDDGSILDVVEMDAASNNGVDDIRDLRDETAYTPSACQYKVYIIDEVHMLSTAAFNALLKTLEEPPAHVIFILATTEIQKVPATILSRCQRYDFTRIGPEDIARRVEYIAGEEKLELTSDGAELIARLADGALRDALSILDTCAGVTAKIDADVVRRMAGVTDRSYLFHISDALEAQDAAAALAQLAQLRQQSVDVKRLTEELIAHYRALMLAALPGGQALLSGVSPEEEALYLQKGPEMGQREAIRAIRATSRSHDRPHVVECMGRHCGDIALKAACATGSEIVVVPEVPWSVEEVASRLNKQIAKGNYRSTIVLAEGCWESMAPFDMYGFLTSHGKQCFEGEPMSAMRFASIMKRMCGMVEARSTVVGYTQRGALPVAKDSAFAFEAGNLAVRLLRDGISNQVIGVRQGKVFNMPILDALKVEKHFRRDLYDLVNNL